MQSYDAEQSLRLFLTLPGEQGEYLISVTALYGRDTPHAYLHGAQFDRGTGSGETLAEITAWIGRQGAHAPAGPER